jgi:hypothetical protein
MPARNRASQQAAVLARQTRARLRLGGNAPRGLSASWAEKHQPDVLAGDFTLREQARLRHPAVLWWWGDRTVGERHGAYCYLCDDFIVTYDSRWPMTREAERAILEHRDSVHAAA